MINSEPDIISIVVTYNGEKWIHNCLDTLKKSKGVEHTIIVVDNNSSDKTLEIIERFHPEVLLLNQKLNLGFGKANNVGIKYAIERFRPESIFLLNQDTTVEDEFMLKKLIDAARVYPEFGIISPIHFNDDGTDYDFMFKTYVGSVSALQQFSTALLTQPESIYEVPFINAAAWLVNSEVFKKVGFFNPIFPHYGEDADFVFRVNRNGYKLGVSTAGVIRHYRNNRNKFIKESLSKEVQKKYIKALVFINDVNRNFYTSCFKYLQYELVTSLKCIGKGNFEVPKLSFLVLKKVIKNSIAIYKNRSHSLPK